MKPKGLPKSGGRKRGATNKITSEMKDKIQLFVENNFEQLQADFQLVEAKDRLIIFEKLLKYVIPTKVEQAVIKEDDDSQQINITISGIDMNLS